MALNPTTREMSDAHEARLAQAFAGSVQPGSGNQWHHQGDIRNAHDMPFAFCADGKSTIGKSISVTLEMIAKIIEQAAGERPAFGLRFYGSGDVNDVTHDLVLLWLSDFEEMLPAARSWIETEAATGYGNAGQVLELIESAREAVARERAAQAGEDRILAGQAGAKIAALQDENDSLQAEVATLRLQLARREGGEEVPEYIPSLPWTVVNTQRLPGRTEKAGVYYDAQGHRQSFTVSEVRVERSPDSLNRPWIIVNGIRVPDCSLYQDGQLHALASKARQSIEVG